MCETSKSLPEQNISVWFRVNTVCSSGPFCANIADLLTRDGTLVPRRKQGQILMGRLGKAVST